jgi:hypothetical protein
MATKLEELEAKLATLQAGPTAAELEAQKIADLERKIAKAELLARATATLGKIGDDWECVSFPDGRNAILKRPPSSFYRMMQDKDNLDRETIMSVARAALWETTVVELDAMLERYPAGIVQVSQALGMLGGADRVAIVGKPSGS